MGIKWLKVQILIVKKKQTLLSPLMLLQIGQQVAYVYLLIATRVFHNCQKSYGFKLIWSYDNFSTDFSLLKDLLRKLNSCKIKIVVFFPGQGLIYIKISLVRLNSNLSAFICQNQIFGVKTPTGEKMIWTSIFWRFTEDFHRKLLLT